VRRELRPSRNQGTAVSIENKENVRKKKKSNSDGMNVSSTHGRQKEKEKLQAKDKKHGRL